MTNSPDALIYGQPGTVVSSCVQFAELQMIVQLTWPSQTISSSLHTIYADTTNSQQQYTPLSRRDNGYPGNEQYKVDINLPSCEIQSTLDQNYEEERNIHEIDALIKGRRGKTTRKGQQNDFKRHLLTHLEEHFVCPHCEKKFSHTGNLARHIHTIHSKDKVYQCRYCGASFLRSDYLSEHEKSHRGDTKKRPRRYQCAYCSYRAPSRATAKQHETRHTGVKPYQCSYCGARLGCHSSLVTHERIHTGEKPYRCSQCSKCFARSSTLYKHERRHTGEKPYDCSHCQKRFAVRYGLTCHLKSRVCQRGYRRKRVPRKRAKLQV